ncbi:hypothetical protein TNCV_1630201 [Trichonephila clavipes]|uniref:Endonuclease-reverse transcriptase n=1 Tax=Trichonephila clavipes TaxID=2585209 RepID=A0A8X6VW98_TRICX|nr:hypothetical protein TNCV_1630201 [Trichonephila clavipes]
MILLMLRKDKGKSGWDMRDPALASLSGCSFPETSRWLGIHWRATLSLKGKKTVNDEQAADLLGLHYQKISRLNFLVEDRNIKIRASRIVHGCCSDTHRGTSIFSRDFRVNELEAAIGDFYLNKSSGPDGIHGQRIDHLGLSGRQRFLDIINCSWNKGKLPRDWRRATVIPY